MSRRQEGSRPKRLMLTKEEMSAWTWLVSKGIANVTSGLSEVVGHEIRVNSLDLKQLPIKDIAALDELDYRFIHSLKNNGANVVLPVVILVAPVLVVAFLYFFLYCRAFAAVTGFCGT